MGRSPVFGYKFPVHYTVVIAKYGKASGGIGEIMKCYNSRVVIREAMLLCKLIWWHALVAGRQAHLGLSRLCEDRQAPAPRPPARLVCFRPIVIGVEHNGQER